MCSERKHSNRTTGNYLCLHSLEYGLSILHACKDKVDIIKRHQAIQKYSANSDLSWMNRREENKWLVCDVFTEPQIVKYFISKYPNFFSQHIKSFALWFYTFIFMYLYLFHNLTLKIKLRSTYWDKFMIWCTRQVLISIAVHIGIINVPIRSEMILISQKFRLLYVYWTFKYCFVLMITQCGLITQYGDIDESRWWLLAWWHQGITWTNVDVS